MHFPIASLVPLGQLESFGIPGYLAQTIEDDVLRDGQVIRGVNRFTLMNDNRIAVERVSMENEETPLELSEIFADHFEQDEKA